MPMEPNRPTRTIRRLTDLSGRSQNPNTATTEDGEDGGAADEAAPVPAPAAKAPAITQAIPNACAEEAPQREFGLGTAQSLATVPAMVLEDDLASQLVVEESEVFDDPFYEALVATEEGVPEPAPVSAAALESAAEALPPIEAEALPEAGPRAEPEPEAESEPKPKPELEPANAGAADETPDEANESIDNAEELPNTTASGLLSNDEQPRPSSTPEQETGSTEAAPSSDGPATEASEQAPESVETPEHEPEPKSEPEPEPNKPPEEKASTEIVATKKPEAKPHGFRAWLHRLFHHS